MCSYCHCVSSTWYADISPECQHVDANGAFGLRIPRWLYLRQFARNFTKNETEINVLLLAIKTFWSKCTTLLVGWCYASTWVMRNDHGGGYKRQEPSSLLPSSMRLACEQNMFNLGQNSNSCSWHKNWLRPSCSGQFINLLLCLLVTTIQRCYVS